MTFKKNIMIRWGHCDPAGIIFFPRYAELCNDVVEDLFCEALGVSLWTFTQKLRLGIPFVHLNMDFLAPSIFNETLEFELAITAMGRSSITFNIDARCGAEERLRAVLKVAMISLDTWQTVPIDDNWRGKFAPFMSAG
ncbi:MAG: acyl-CoA thioesterase [Syntrophobacterales bacterium]|jgi:4-hydroxybenzoyl-CoA thioesterase|nr:acyl-CoA thioesterase [Syntrophobacterales bacterium]